MKAAVLFILAVSVFGLRHAPVSDVRDDDTCADTAGTFITQMSDLIENVRDVMQGFSGLD
jgi:hypothetical protein